MLKVIDCLSGLQCGNATAALWIPGTSALGVVLSVAFFTMICRCERHEIESRVSELVGEQISDLRLLMLRSIEVLYAITSLRAMKEAIETGRIPDVCDVRVEQAA